MHSIRTKTILLNLIAITVAIFVATLISAISISKLGHDSSEHTLALLCEEGKQNLGSYFESVEQSVNTVSGLLDDNLDTIDDASFNTDFSKHIDDADTIFRKAAENTNGVLTYYYRIDPSISNATNEKGFWYTNLDGKGFISHEVTDLSDDQFECKWFYEPKNTGKPLWLSPYVTDNLDEYVISYNAPVYRHNDFVGVVGIEISYLTLGDQIKDIKAHKTGCAFIIENQTGTIIYHPRIDLFKLPEAERPQVPVGIYDGITRGEHHVEYFYDNQAKHGYWLELSNGMDIVVAVPLSEVNASWLSTVIIIIISAVVILGAFTVITILYTRRITKPLKELTEAAVKINDGDYDVKLNYKNDDEIGVLTTTVNRLVEHLGDYIDDLNNLAYTDSLTSVLSKNAFDLAISELEARLNDEGETIQFAIAMFDSDNLKIINDHYGHDKGNVYLKNASHLICRVFQNSKVYRLGGDEFAIILEGEDFKKREKLRKYFIEKSAEISAFAKEPWEEIRVSIGIATYDHEVDKSVKDVIVHADHLMYDNKRIRKKNGQ